MRSISATFQAETTSRRKVGIAADLVDDPGDLIVGPTVRPLPGAPLLAVDRTEISVRVGPLVPDGNAVRLEISDVGVAPQKPDELAHDRLEMKPLGCDERKALGEIEAKLPAEQRTHAGPCAVRLDGAAIERLAHEVEIGLHGRRSFSPNRPQPLYRFAFPRARRLRAAVIQAARQCRLTVSSSFSQALAIAASLESVSMIGDPSAPSSANNVSPGFSGGA